MKYYFKKNWAALLVSIVIVIAPFLYKAYVMDDYDIPTHEAKTIANKVDVTINEDGSMQVVEEMQLKTKWKEVYKDISYSASNLIGENNKISSNTAGTPKFSLAPEDTYVKMEKNNQTIIEGDATSNIGDQNSSTSLQFSFIDGAIAHRFEGDYRDIEITCPVANCQSIYLFDENGLGPEVKITYSYKILGAVTVFDDIAEINWKFATTNNMKTSNVNVNVHLPNKQDLLAKDVYIYGHGANGKVNHNQDDVYNIKLSAKKLSPTQEIEARILFPKELLDLTAIEEEVGEYGNVHHIEYLSRVEAYEEQLQRESTKLLIGDISVGVVAVLILVFIICMLYKIYILYDKEYVSNFDDEYYRELPENYPPAIMSYLYNFKEIDKNCVSSTLMDLIRKKVVTIEYAGESLTEKKPNYKMIYNGIPNGVVLNNYEAKLIDWFFVCVANGSELTLDQLDDFNGREGNARNYQLYNRQFNSLIASEAKKYNFFEDPKKGREKGNSLILFLLVMIFIFAFIHTSFPLIMPMYAASWMLAMIVIIMFYTRNLVKRTKKGNEDFVRWKAFKHFLEEFSNIKDYPMPGIIVWDHYMVYASAFGIADLVEEQLRFKYSSLNMEDQLNDSLYLNSPSFSYYFASRISNSYSISARTIAQANSQRAARNTSGGGRGGFGGGSSFGGGGTGMRGR